MYKAIRYAIRGVFSITILDNDHFFTCLGSGCSGTGTTNNKEGGD
jgi:hypothetical protein